MTAALKCKTRVPLVQNTGKMQLQFVAPWEQIQISAGVLAVCQKIFVDFVRLSVSGHQILFDIKPLKCIVSF
jgi:hypothetical protein